MEPGTKIKIEVAGKVTGRSRYLDCHEIEDDDGNRYWVNIGDGSKFEVLKRPFSAMPGDIYLASALTWMCYREYGDPYMIASNGTTMTFKQFSDKYPDAKKLIKKVQ